MTEDKNFVFSKEYDILQASQNVLIDGEVGKDILLDNYQGLIKNYKKLLRRTETLTRVSDNQQRKLNGFLERLGRYVSYQLFKKITEGKEKVGTRTQRKKLTVFFSDLKDFSYTSSHMEGEALSEFLNSYLESMTQIVIKWGGTLDKYMGDAIMVFFGDPEFTTDEDHALRCVFMAIEMREKMKEMRKKWYDFGYQEPLHFRMGIATGYCTVGNFGSSERMDYTIIGTPVNLASRLETVAETDEILISHETWGYVKDKVICAPPQRMHLKGFHQEILGHKVLYIKDDNRKNIVSISDQEKGLEIKIDFSRISKEDVISIVRNIDISSISAEKTQEN